MNLATHDIPNLLIKKFQTLRLKLQLGNCLFQDRCKRLW